MVAGSLLTRCTRVERTAETDAPRAMDVVLENEPVASALRALSQALALPVVIASDATELAGCVRISVRVPRSAPRAHAVRQLEAALARSPLEAEAFNGGWILRRRDGEPLPESCRAIAARQTLVPIGPRHAASTREPTAPAPSAAELTAGWPAAPSEEATASVLAGISAIDESRFAITSAALDALIADGPRFAAHLRAFSLYERGAPQGIKLYSIRPGSVWAALGLQSGDTLVELNGIALTDAAQVVRASREIPAMSALRLRVRRRDGAVELTYRVIDSAHSSATTR